MGCSYNRSAKRAFIMTRTPDALTGYFKSVADVILDSVTLALETRGQAHLVLGGGRTPIGVHKNLLAEERRDSIDWNSVHIWVSDERMVPFEHPDSNAGMIWRTLGRPLGMKRGQLHGPAGELNPVAAARIYDRELGKRLEVDEEMDLSVLGVGEDGHTASLFPKGLWAGTDVPAYAAAVGKGPDGYERVTMLPYALLKTRKILLLANTPAKSVAIEAAEGRGYDPVHYPLHILQVVADRVIVAGLL